MSDVKPSLTKRQQQVYDIIVQELERNGYPPSVREIGEKLGLSSSATVQAHLSTLEKKGYLSRSATKSRTITLTEAPGRETEVVSDAPVAAELPGMSHIPLVGRIAAGSPILAEQNVEETYALPVSLVGDRASFMLEIRGDSMIEAGILDGDYVIVREQSTADDGTIVAALLGEEATVKVLYHERDCLRLQPRNASMEPIYTDDAVVMGVVVGLIRTL